RRLVRPLQVIEHDQQRLVALYVGQERVDRLEELLANLVRGELGADGNRPDLLAQPRRERGQQRTVVAHGLLQRLGARGRDGRTEDLAEWTVRAAGHHEAAPAENEASLSGGFAGDLAREPRRADAAR